MATISVSTLTRAPAIGLGFKLLALATPLLLLVSAYIWFDPFRVVRTQPFGNYYDEQPVELNREYVSTTMFLEKYPRHRYEAFILGSSRSFPYHCRDWKRHIGDVSCFHYPAASENLLGIASKLEFLEKQGVRISHVLFEGVSWSFADVSPKTDHLHRPDWRVSGESWWTFQGIFLRAYLTDFFWLKYLDYRLSGRVRPYARNALGIERGAVKIDPIANDYFFLAEDRALDRDEPEFYRRRAHLFPSRPAAPPCSPPVLGQSQRRYLEAMRALFDRQRTDYRIVIPPMWDQVCLDPGDRRELERIFGLGRVFDFSGRNELTRDARNFYDPTHHRPAVSARIMERMYP